MWVRSRDSNLALSRIAKTVILIATVLIQAACTSQRAPQSILILAIEGLDAELPICNESEEHNEISGFKEICKESIRFSHGFSPSTQTSPAIASLLTGKTPTELGYETEWDHLRAEQISVAELALESGMRTALFSGGPPLLHKTGMQQGFEVFEDAVSVSDSLPFRSFARNLANLKNWWSERPQQGFFSLMYIPDLIYTQRPTRSSFGEARPLTFDSQLDELDENLFELTKFLKEKKLWDNTLILIVGLKGAARRSRITELYPLNLHSEVMQIAMLLKPYTQKKDTTLSWQVDRNIGFPEMGRVLREIVMAKDRFVGDGDTQVGSGLNLVKSAFFQDQNPAPNPLVMAAGWRIDKSLAYFRYAVLFEKILYIHGQRPGYFNQLTDAFELIRLNHRDLNPVVREKIQETILMLDPEKSMISPKERSFYRNLFFEINRPTIHLTSIFGSYKITELSKLGNSILYILADLAMEQKNYKVLEALASDLERPDLHDIASVIENKTLRITDSCFKQFTSESSIDRVTRFCRNENQIKLWEWLKAKGDKRKYLERQLYRVYKELRYDRRMLYLNIEKGWPWSISPMDTLLGPLDLTLHLKMFAKLKAKWDQRTRFEVTPIEEE